MCVCGVCVCEYIVKKVFFGNRFVIRKKREESKEITIIKIKRVCVSEYIYIYIRYRVIIN